jgi:hypothetical protein
MEKLRQGPMLHLGVKGVDDAVISDDAYLWSWKRIFVALLSYFVHGFFSSGHGPCGINLLSLG